MKSGSIVADLKKDYFLLCKKENLARTKSTNNNRRATTLDSTSCGVSHVNSPTSPCQWNMSFNPLQQLDNVFDGDVKSVTDVVSSADDDTKEVCHDTNIDVMQLYLSGLYISLQINGIENSKLAKGDTYV